MVKIEPQSNVCYKCDRFRGYYTKNKTSFDRTKNGYCYEHNKIVYNSDSCDCWRNNYRRSFLSKVDSLKLLSELLAAISGIRQIFEEAQEENNNRHEKL